MDPYHWYWPGFGFMWIFPLLFLIDFALLLFRGPWWSPGAIEIVIERSPTVNRRGRFLTGATRAARSPKNSTRT